MNKILYHLKMLTSLAAGLLLFVSVMWDLPVAAASEMPIKVLIVTGMDHPAHDWRQTTAALQEELCRDPRMKVNVLEDPYGLDSVDLAVYDVVFINFNNWEKPSPGPQARSNLQRFVAGGGGLVLMHFACGAFLDWDEFPRMAGRVWDKKNTHDPRGHFQVDLVNSSHPVTKGLESYTADDELYTCLTGSRPVELLARARSKVTGNYHPIAFVLDYDKGRVFQTTLGHDARAIHVAGTSRLLRNGVAWTAGRPVVFIE